MPPSRAAEPPAALVIRYWDLPRCKTLASARGHFAIDFGQLCSQFVLVVKTLGQAWKLGWRARARCFVVGPKPKSRDRTSIYCDTTTELDMKTLVWTRGELMPLDQLASRLKCPKCGRMNVQVIFEVPGEPNARTARAAE
jgi:hypothetical protein